MSLAVDLECDAVALIPWHFIQAMAVTIDVQFVELPLLLFVQFSEDVIAAVLSIDNRVSFLPTGHR